MRIVAIIIAAAVSGGLAEPGARTFAPVLFEVEYWREGPIVIEAQVNPGPHRASGPAEIIRVDKHGIIWRQGAPIEGLDREDLVDVIQELVAYEVAKSSPAGK